jgi:hypothetical protein
VTLISISSPKVSSDASPLLISHVGRIYAPRNLQYFIRKEFLDSELPLVNENYFLGFKFCQETGYLLGFKGAKNSEHVKLCWDYLAKSFCVHLLVFNSYHDYYKD